MNDSIYHGSEVDRLKAIIADLDERLTTALIQRNRANAMLRRVVEHAMEFAMSDSFRNEIESALEGRT